MPSPFPGMDPYLEDPAVWSDFHGTFLMAIRAELNRRLPPHYVARWDRYVWIDDSNGEPKIVGKPDTFVVEKQGREEEAGSVAVLAAPATIRVPAVDPKGKPFLKIIDARNRRVVTAVELLSPANKNAPRRENYLEKRQEYFRSKTNLVEIDLLRSGVRPPFDDPPPKADYYVLVCQAVNLPRAGIWAFGVRDPLPTIPIPLSGEDAPLRLELRPCLDRAYEEGRFADDIDYHEPPVPPLKEPDAAWARELLAAKKPE
jgi:hypothetical protein